MKITDVKLSFAKHYLFVHIYTDEGIVGLGEAGNWGHLMATAEAIKKFSTWLIGKDPSRIDDIGQNLYRSLYFRGSVIMSAISAIDIALWDIKGKMANMPLYSLLGGRSRTGILVYRHADGNSIDAVEKMISDYISEGYRYIRCQMGTYGGNYDGTRQEISNPKGSFNGSYYNPDMYMRSVIDLFRHVRADFGNEIGLLHDIHERLTPIDALSLVKKFEEFDMFFVEDALSPAQGNYFKYMREQTAVPLAMGELFANSLEWKSLVENQWIDFVRAHLSDIGGLTPAIKLAHFCDAYSVRTAWHGPSDLSPIGMTAQMHLDLNIHNFGIQEFSEFTDEEREVFPGCPEHGGDGYVYLSDRPGIGVDFDEKKAAKYPAVDMDHSWMFTRITDGTAVRP